MTGALDDQVGGYCKSLMTTGGERVRERLGVAGPRLVERWIGTTRAEFHGAAWSPAEDGRRVITAPIFTMPRRLRHVFQTWNGATDILAFRLDDPSRWALRKGTADALGFAHPAADPDHGFTLHLVGDPLAWLRADDRHFMALDWPALDYLWEGTPARVVCDTAATAEAATAARAAAMLARRLAPPRFLVPRAA